MRRWALVLGGCAAWLAVAGDGDKDARGWSPGTAAAGLAATTGPKTPEPVQIELPKALAKLIHRQTLLIYLSPTCPHCHRVSPELSRLKGELADWADIIAFVPGSFSEAEVAAFVAEYKLPFTVLRDKDHSMAAAIQAGGTPSALLVKPAKGSFEIVDLWYPFSPGSGVQVRMRASGNAFGVFEKDRYLGTDTCGTCHTEELSSWYLSHHSIAWGTLKEIEKHDDPKCVSCHVTGAGQRTGWVPTDPGTPLTDVGCESCHGPGGPHDGAVTEPKDQCATCHDAEHSIAFSYDKGLPLIDHFKATAMDEAAFREAREALVEGRSERGLLAFPTGRTVGSRACATCHAAEHQAWSSSKHASAMALLPPHKAEDKVECVACHATGVTSGPGTRGLADYRTDEGVGCESCHGPGEQHVKAGGGKDNIVGLGESCPVCVIEAVCTSCHTEAWDPLWKLDERLPAVKHTAAP
jgi:thiol-disulfide isomerase/thioredoxin